VDTVPRGLVLGSSLGRAEPPSPRDRPHAVCSPAMLAHCFRIPREARGRVSRLIVGPNGLSCEATETDGGPMRRSNKAFKLTSASRVEALRATTRGQRSQLNAMLCRP
jgi:hypothetical protein